VAQTPVVPHSGSGRAAAAAQRLRRALACALFGLAGFAVPAGAQAPQPDGAGLSRGVLPRAWRASGPDCPARPEFEVHEYNASLVILRESGCSNYEKPFLFLLLGTHRALLLDTGAGETNVGEVVGSLVDRWRRERGDATLELVVAHTHAHGDHIAGDAQFRNRPHTTLVEPTPAAVQAYFGFRDWPNDVATLDLGGRLLDVVAIPGHEPSSIAVYDRQTAILFTGDSLYPGRLYVRDAPAFARSIQRLVDFTAGKPLAHVLGNHIEQTRTPYLDYPVGTVYQPDEHVLELGRGELLELNAALGSMAGAPRRAAYRDFTIWPKD